MKFTRFAFAGTLILALSGLLLWSAHGAAGGEGKLPKQIDDMVTALKKGDAKAAKSLAEKIAEQEEEVYYPMLLFKPRKEGSKSSGFGVGAKAGEMIPDGIELMLKYLDRDGVSKQKLESNKDAYIDMAYRINAINHIAQVFTPKSKADAWKDYVQQLDKSSMDFVAAVKAGSPAEVQKFAKQMNSACNNCHSDYR